VKHTLAVLVENKPGALMRIASMFARRGYNIESLAVGPTERHDVSRVTIRVDCEQHPLEQIEKQMHKLVNVLRVAELAPGESVERELALIKVDAPPERRAELLALGEVFHARVADLGPEALVFEVVGAPEEIDSFEELVRPHGVKELVRTGRLSPEEAESHPQRSVITRALGTDPDVDVDSFSVEAKPGDLFLICSDGLTSMVGDEEILDVVEPRRGDLDVAAKELVAAANRSGGEDNITVVFFEVVEDGATAQAPGETKPMPALGVEPRPQADEDTLTELDRVPTIDTMVVSPEAARAMAALSSPRMWTRTSSPKSRPARSFKR